jgi:hypothetical protein
MNWAVRRLPAASSRHWLRLISKNSTAVPIAQAPNRGGPGFIPSHVMWNLRWTKWYWGRLPHGTFVSPANSRPTKCSILIYHPGLVQLVADVTSEFSLTPTPTKHKGKNGTYRIGRYLPLFSSSAFTIWYLGKDKLYFCADERNFLFCDAVIR